MKIVVFQDIHANIEVLNKICDLPEYIEADYRIFLGDIIGLGPDCKECIDKLKTMDTINLMGNHDYWIADHMGQKLLKNCVLDKILCLQYFRSTLDKEDREYIKSFKKDLTIEIYGKKLYFTHFIWEGEEDTIHSDSREKEDLLTLYKDYDYDYIFYGHEHDPHVVIGMDKSLICFGSTGMVHPGYYGVIDIDDNGIKLSQKTIDFDLNHILDKITTLKYPLSQKFVNFYTNPFFHKDINSELNKIK